MHFPKTGIIPASLFYSAIAALTCYGADIAYTGSGADDNWTTTDNWQGGSIPADSSTGAAFWNDNTHVVIEPATDITCNGFMLGMYGSTNSAEMTGGSLDCGWLDIGRCNQNGGDGTLTLRDGWITVSGNLSIPQQFSTLTDPAKIGHGQMNLLGGSISVGNLHIGDGQVGQNGGVGGIHITEGTLIVNGNQISAIQSHIDLGHITTDSFRSFLLDYDTSNSGKTTLHTESSLFAIYTDAAADHKWSTDLNWQDGTAPNDTVTDALFTNSHTLVQIDDGTSASSLSVALGMYGATNSAEISGGSLNCNTFDVGHGNQNGGNGTLTLTGGELHISGSLRVPHQLGSLTDPSLITRGHVDLLGGTIHAEALQFGHRQTGQGGGIGSLYITEGTLILDGDQIEHLEAEVNRGYLTTDLFRIFLIDYDTSHSGKTTLRTEISFQGQAGSPNPMHGSTLCKDQVHTLRWSAVPGAESYQLYFGTSSNPPLIATLSAHQRSYALPELDDNQTYYWRVDTTWREFTNASQVWSFTTDSTVDCDTPPFTNYCDMLSQEVQGKKHGFLAGNNTYYIGGFHASWNPREDETIGFTHPFHNDLRSRGYGMAEDDETGYGHDFSGWEFYKHTKVAYGTVIIDGTRYEHPVPTAMYWRPDRMICEYQVAGVNIREDKFIALNDAACSIITSDAPITLEFAGQSFYKDGVTQSTTASCTFDAANNAVHIIDEGVNLVIPSKDPVHSESPEDDQVPGVMMYDGMSTILSASKPIENYSNTTESTGQQKYSFTVPCDAGGVSLVWAMHDDGATAIAETQTILANPHGELHAKTDHMNDLLNNQIPYFRCSDQDIVDVYYFLWAIHLMYYIDLSDENPDFTPHTQSAVNNFLGIHRYDAAMQIPVGSWAVDKATYANGNVLRWKTMLEHADLSTGRIPADNLGKTWYSGLWGGVTSHVPGAWQIYQHSGDLEFLAEAYTFYRALMWNAMPGFWGRQYTAADCLGYMALELGYPQSEADHWQELVNSDNIDNWFNYAWTNHGYENYFGFGTGKGWNTFGYMRTRDFPQDWARAIVETWAIDGSDGFVTNDLLAVKPRGSWDEIDLDAFFITPDTNTYMLLGMFDTHVDDYATRLAVDHLKNYNFHEEWEIPIAPEAIDKSYGLFGDQYSNFNAGKILVILEGICGLSYSVVDDSFTVAENLPLEWDYMETYVPIKHNGPTQWTRVMVTRDADSDGVVSKKIKIQNNQRSLLRLEPWLEGMSVLNAPAGYINGNAPGHIAYEFADRTDTTLELKLTDTDEASLLRQSFNITPATSDESNEISIRFGLGSPPISDTTVILERATQLNVDDFEEIYRFDTSDDSETMQTGVRSNVTPYYFTISDELLPAGSAFYKVRTLESGVE